MTLEMKLSKDDLKSNIKVLDTEISALEHQATDSYQKRNANNFGEKIKEEKKKWKAPNTGSNRLINDGVVEQIRHLKSKKHEELRKIQHLKEDLSHCLHEALEAPVEDITDTLIHEKRRSLEDMQQICVYYFKKVVHPKKEKKFHGKVKRVDGNGSAICINPDCVAFKVGQAVQSRDKQSSLLIGQHSVSRLLRGAPFPILDPKTSHLNTGKTKQEPPLSVHYTRTVWKKHSSYSSSDKTSISKPAVYKRQSTEFKPSLHQIHKAFIKWRV
ncbi:hypothetical protein K501DRAFT_272214 [Backusella circina FSU 941]|nr:hypothetical protein K501DRAFT_272214 [Backusella circina FSU 941]